MSEQPIRLLAISGSLRQASSNTALLRAAQRVAPVGVEIAMEEGIGALPWFNPDLDPQLPAEVVAFRERIAAADGLLFSTPEYAHGVPGVLKNALDWLVSGPEFVEKPVGVLHASAYSTHAHASLLETIRVMSAAIVNDAVVVIPLHGRRLGAGGILGEDDLVQTLRGALEAMAGAIRRSRAAL